MPGGVDIWLRPHSPLPHSHGPQPQGAGNSGLTAWLRSVSPAPAQPQPQPILWDQPSNGFCCYMQQNAAPALGSGNVHRSTALTAPVVLADT